MVYFVTRGIQCIL